MNAPEPRPQDIRRARRAFLIVGLVAPLLLAVVAVALTVLWLPDVPDRIITHWGIDGPDGFASPALYVWVQVLAGFGIPLLITLPVLAMMKDSWGVTCRLLASISLGASALIAVGTVGSVAIQRESAEGPSIGAVLAIGFGGMLVLGVVGWLAQPRVSVPSASTRARQLNLVQGERAAWFGTAAMGRPGVISLVIAVLLLIVTTAWVFVMDGASGWIMAGVTLLVVALISVTMVFRVRASAAGLRVHSILGWPRWNIPASDITDARVVQVNPTGEFGGWGLRLAVDGRRGIVLRTGEGLQVTSRSGRILVITIDDAATAASVLTAVKGVNS